MRHGAPRILVAPGPTARRPSGPGGWAERIALGRSRVVVLVLPVEAPLVADTGQRAKPPRVGPRVHHPRRSIEREGGRARVTPGVARSIEPSAGGSFPLGFAGKAVPPAGLVGEPVTIR